MTKVMADLKFYLIMRIYNLTMIKLQGTYNKLMRLGNTKYNVI
jgi:hypothetical protein